MDTRFTIRARVPASEANRYGENVTKLDEVTAEIRLRSQVGIEETKYCLNSYSERFNAEDRPFFSIQATPAKER